MNAPVAQASKTASLPEDISKQIDALRADLMKFASTVTGDVSDGIGNAGRQLSKTGRDARATATNTVLEHPLASIGIAAGIGLLIGLIVRKG